MAETEQTVTEATDCVSAETIEVLVGERKTKFIIDPRIVCERSTFFKAALAKRWNSEKKPIELEDDRASVFKRYLKWITEGDEAVTSDVDRFLDLVRIYILADKLGDLAAANSIIDAIIKRADQNGRHPGPDCIEVAFNQCPESSPLRRVIVDFYVHEGTLESLDKLDDEAVPRSFLVAVAKAFWELRGSRNVFRKISDVYEDGWDCQTTGKCYYHQHDVSHPKCIPTASTKHLTRGPVFLGIGWK